MSEFAFELALAAHLERTTETVVSRQLGAAVHGRRVVDTVLVEPGPAFAERAAITSDAIPPVAIESDVGPGRAKYWKRAIDAHPEFAREVVEATVETGFFERERRNGRRYVRQTTRYPEDWFDDIVAIENKPDLGTPGALQTQLRTDVALGLADEVVLATESHVTGAHRNRIPDAVGIWRFDPETGAREVLREADSLSPDEAGVEILDETPGRTAIRCVTADEKARARRRLAERAYGKGWRTFDVPACARVDVTDDGRPYCPYHERIVRPATDCGTDCAGHDPAAPPDDAPPPDTLRASRTPWDPDPDGRRRQQSGLDRFTDAG